MAVPSPAVQMSSTTAPLIVFIETVRCAGVASRRCCKTQRPAATSSVGRGVAPGPGSMPVATAQGSGSAQVKVGGGGGLVLLIRKQALALASGGGGGTMDSSALS